jgi:hypothetical protein
VSPTSKKTSWGILTGKGSSILTDLPIAFAGMALFYGLISLACYWTAPVTIEAQIDLSPRALPVYALYSVARLAVAYFLSLAVSLIYGYVAANHAKAERLMISGMRLTARNHREPAGARPSGRLERSESIAYNYRPEARKNTAVRVCPSGTGRVILLPR